MWDRDMCGTGRRGPKGSRSPSRKAAPCAPQAMGGQRWVRPSAWQATASSACSLCPHTKMRGRLRVAPGAGSWAAGVCTCSAIQGRCASLPGWEASANTLWCAQSMPCHPAWWDCSLKHRQWAQVAVALPGWAACQSMLAQRWPPGPCGRLSTSPGSHLQKPCRHSPRPLHWFRQNCGEGGRHGGQRWDHLRTLHTCSRRASCCSGCKTGCMATRIGSCAASVLVRNAPRRSARHSLRAWQSRPSGDIDTNRRAPPMIAIIQPCRRALLPH